jgi:class 3 adenylate cyclase
MSDLNLHHLLASLSTNVKTELASTPDVLDKGHDLDIDTLPIEARRWHRATEVVAVFADLKNSSRLGTGIHASSTASVYEAAVGGLVRVYDSFDADYLDIQGDAAFAVFWGRRRLERGMCAAITARTFSSDLTDQLEQKWPEQPETGFRVGVAASAILVKRVGTPRNPSQQAPVWAGRAVNYASKAAATADRHELVVTGTVWDAIADNEYLTISCGCGGAMSLWADVTIERLRDGDDAEAAGRLLKSRWCPTHGEAFCNAILSGETIRPERSLAALSESVQKSQYQIASRAKAAHERARRRGLRRIA